VDSADEELDALLDEVEARAADPEFLRRVRELSPRDLALLREIEALPCNQPVQDKSWVLRAEESRRRLFREAWRVTWR
jgi:hypothetical protein